MILHLFQEGGKIKVCPEITVNQNHLIIFDPPESGLLLSRKILNFPIAAFKAESYQPSKSHEKTYTFLFIFTAFGRLI